MLNTIQYDILKFISSHNVINPVKALEVINKPFYNGKAYPVITDDHLKFLYDSRYINLDEPLYSEYRTGYGGNLFITSEGTAAMNEFEYQISLSDSIAELKAIADSARALAKTAEQISKAAQKEAKRSLVISIISISIAFFGLIANVLMQLL